MRDESIFYDCDLFYLGCLRFCFMFLIWGEFNKVVIYWNLYKIRFSYNVEFFFGWLDLFYYVFVWINVIDYLIEVDLDDIKVIDGVCCDKISFIYCLEECIELIDIIM